MSDMVSGFPSSRSIETGLKQATKNRLDAQSTRLFVVSFPLELCTGGYAADHLLFLALLFLCFLVLPLGFSSPWKNHFWQACFTCLSSISPLRCSPEWALWLLSAHNTPLAHLSPHLFTLCHCFCNDRPQTKPVQVTVPTKSLHHCLQDKAHTLQGDHQAVRNLFLPNLRRFASSHWASLHLLRLFLYLPTLHLQDPVRSNSNIASLKSSLTPSSLPPWWNERLPHSSRDMFCILLVWHWSHFVPFGSAFICLSP